MSTSFNHNIVLRSNRPGAGPTSGAGSTTKDAMRKILCAALSCLVLMIAAMPATGDTSRGDPYASDLDTASAACPVPSDRVLSMDETLALANLFISCEEHWPVRFTDRTGVVRNYGDAPQLVFFGAVAQEESGRDPRRNSGDGGFGLWQITGVASPGCNLNDSCCNAEWMDNKRQDAFAYYGDPLQPWTGFAIQNDNFEPAWNAAWDSYDRLCAPGPDGCTIVERQNCEFFGCGCSAGRCVDGACSETPQWLPAILSLLD